MISRSVAASGSREVGTGESYARGEARLRSGV
jgi:hypothetical protein